jgi:hypothetical protein
MEEVMTSEDLDSLAWADFMKWAIEQPDLRAGFEAATERRFVDSARYVVEFVEWSTLTLWGIENAPPKYREQLMAKEQRS